ncbi:hypothetical protein [Rhizobium leguminosarum]|uniref:hypothetical protein n=1 Tax=Rhizobium leguminosarum TaxID=384 RepID=UPI001C8FE0DB|nr:hypothetical protein [Rhizobium leguminosarum]MBY3027080.1 hypothetical protein [Rhizobium leguminosarum]
MKNLLPFVALAALGLISPSFGHAAELTPLVTDAKVSGTPDGWQFTVAPYLWIAGISGDTAAFGLPEAHIDSSFSDVFQNLDFAVMAAAEARYDRFSIIGDVIYTKLGADANTRNGLLATSVDVTSKTFAGLLGVGYAVLDGPSGFLDVVAGARVWSVDTTIGFNGGILGGREASDGATWIDAMAGIRGNYFLTPEIYLTGWGLVGTGGADVDWDVQLGLGYKFSDTISAVAGYRALGVDYNDDGFVFDVVQQGPILGLAIRF